MAKQTKQTKLTSTETGALLFTMGILAGVGSTIAAFSQSIEYSFLAILAALVVLGMVNKNK